MTVLFHREQRLTQMMLGQVFQKFARESPLTVMSRVMLATIFPVNQFDQILPKAVDTLQFRESLFSTIVDLMGLVGQIHSKTHVIYHTPHNDLKMVLNAFCQNPKRIKPNVPAGWVKQTADHLDPVVHKMGRILPDSLCGYSVRTVAHIDLSGNRFNESRQGKCRTKPCQSSVVLDPNLMLAKDVFLHAKIKDNAQEDLIYDALLDSVRPQDIWIAPPTFNISSFVKGIERRQAFFVLRQNKAKLPWMPAGRRKLQGQVDLGDVFEQKVQLINGQGNKLLRAALRSSWRIARPMVK